MGKDFHHTSPEIGVGRFEGMDSGGVFPSLKRRGGCGINKKLRSHQRAADGVVSPAKLFRPQRLTCNASVTRHQETRALSDTFQPHAFNIAARIGSGIAVALNRTSSTQTTVR